MWLDYWYYKYIPFISDSLAAASAANAVAVAAAAVSGLASPPLFEVDDVIPVDDR